MTVIAWRDGVHIISSDWPGDHTVLSFEAAYERVRKWLAGRWPVVTEISNSEGYFTQHIGLLSSYDFTQVLKRTKRGIAWTAVTVQVASQADETKCFPWITAFVAPSIRKGEENVSA